MAPLLRRAVSDLIAGQSGGGSSPSRTLAWSEPLTALLRSAQSRVSSSRSLERPTRTPHPPSHGVCNAALTSRRTGAGDRRNPQHKSFIANRSRACARAALRAARPRDDPRQSRARSTTRRASCPQFRDSQLRSSKARAVRGSDQASVRPGEDTLADHMQRCKSQRALDPSPAKNEGTEELQARVDNSLDRGCTFFHARSSCLWYERTNSDMLAPAFFHINAVPEFPTR